MIEKFLNVSHIEQFKTEWKSARKGTKEEHSKKR